MHPKGAKPGRPPSPSTLNFTCRQSLAAGPAVGGTRFEILNAEVCNEVANVE